MKKKSKENIIKGVETPNMHRKTKVTERVVNDVVQSLRTNLPCEPISVKPG
jgi:hypothetical protein